MSPQKSDASRLINEISQRDASLDDYNNLEIMFSNMNIQDFNYIAEESKIVEMLIKMDLTNSEVYNLALKFTSKIFDTVDLKNYIEKNPESVNSVLTSQNSQFKIFLLEKLVSYLNGPQEVRLDSSIIFNIFLNIFDEHEGVMTHSKNYFKKYPNMCSLIEANPKLHEHTLKLTSYVSKLRALELYIELSGKNSFFNKYLEDVLTQPEVDGYIQNSDFLISINFFQVIIPFLDTRDGFQLLNKSSYSFLNLVKNIDSDPFSNLKKPYINSVMIGLMKGDPKYWSENETFVEYFKKELNNTSIDAIEAISWSLQYENCLEFCIKLLSKEWNEFLPKLKHLVYTFSSSDEKILSCLAFICNVDYCTCIKCQKTKSDLILHLNAGKNLLDRLAEHTKLPYLRMRKLVLIVLKGLAKNDFTYDLIINNNKTLDYLLSRICEANIVEEKKSLLEIKLEINQILAKKVGGSLRERFENYVKEGIFGKNSNVTQIAME